MKTFTEETNDFLVGIKFNNNKEWFHANKDMYKNYVHEPMVELANRLCDKINLMDKSQVLLPRVSRANRDVRFSSNKMPYKISKWFFLRTNTSSKIWYQKPTIFFEATMECWSYGFYFHSSPSDMEKYRKMIYANTAEAERMADFVQKQKHFLVEGEMYKKIFNKEVSEKVNYFAQRKWVSFTRYEEYDNTDFYSENLCDIVYNNILRIYPLYQYFNSIEV